MIFQGVLYFQDALQLLDRVGFTDVFLPFILIFTIVFAVLQKINLFSDVAGGSRKFNGLISLALAIGVIIPHSLGRYPPGADVVEIINNALPGISLLIVAIVFFLIIVGMFGGRTKWGESSTGGTISIIALIVIIFIFGNAAGWWQATGIFFYLSDPTIQAALLILLVFWIVLSIVTKEENKPGAATKIGEFFGGLTQAAEEAEKTKGKS